MDEFPMEQASPSQRRRAGRLAVGLGVAGALVAAGVGTAIAVDGSPGLPQVSASELLNRMQNARVDSLSGTLRVQITPPAGENQTSYSTTVLQQLQAASVRVAIAGDGKQRIETHGFFGDAALIRNGQDVWLYDAQRHTAAHTTAPAPEKPKKTAPARTATRTPAQTPVAQPWLDLTDLPVPVQQDVKELFSAVRTHADARVTGTDLVAGRDVYLLELRPKSDLAPERVHKVEVAVDAKTSIPLRVEVYGPESGTPIVRAGFTQISFGKPGDSEFTLPQDVKVVKGEQGFDQLARSFLSKLPRHSAPSSMPTQPGR
ncbi:hypothetical protein C3Y87_04090 [Carbonactinospora thermoautotrophica]|uniref:LolA family protein n=1 Tax=Carbonactinospora thermoautotrophica TaxID=1469144 RepID=UPI00226DC308|nr:sigma-E factor regulatory protein RseB domain-containing protein [Carbonactinospora thermoautotrophica]MCX9190605.1 hypothetical protein [Carbonactinospora thermoautotrophica]